MTTTPTLRGWCRTCTELGSPTLLDDGSELVVRYRVDGLGRYSWHYCHDHAAAARTSLEHVAHTGRVGSLAVLELELSVDGKVGALDDGLAAGWPDRRLEARQLVDAVDPNRRRPALREALALARTLDELETLADELLPGVAPRIAGELVAEARVRIYAAAAAAAVDELVEAQLVAQAAAERAAGLDPISRR